MLAEPAGVPLRGYRLGERLGTGRDGTVYAARLPGVERDFAIRVIRQEIADGPEFVRSFEATAHRVASLRHPAIVAIHDYWREPGAAYLVMRRMYGGTLRDRLDRGPLTTRRGGGAGQSHRRRAGRRGRAVGSCTVGSSRRACCSTTAGEPTWPTSCSARRTRTRRQRRRARLRRDVASRCLRRTRAGPGRVDDSWRAALRRSAGRRWRSSCRCLSPPSPARTTVGDDGPPNPYKGLRAFDEADAADFFGRADLVDEILARLGRRRPARTARAGRRRIRHRQVERRAGRAVATGAPR